MTDLDDEDLASQAIRRGAQDYLLKGQVDAALVARSIRHAIERKQIEERLQRILASMSNELRTQVNSIADMTSLALSEELPAGVRDYLATARESAGQLLKLLNEILDSSRATSAQFDVEQIPFSRNHAIDVRETLPERESSGVRVGLTVKKPAAIAQAAPERLLRVLLAEDTPSNQKILLHILESADTRSRSPRTGNRLSSCSADNSSTLSSRTYKCRSWTDIKPPVPFGCCATRRRRTCRSLR